MRRSWPLIVLFLVWGGTLRAADVPPKLDARKLGNLYVVAIGQEDGWKFLPEGFERVVRDQSKDLYREFHSKVLTGAKATRKELLDAIASMCKKAKADDLVMVFIACHGSCTSEGESVFATRKGTVRPRDIKSLLAKIPCHAIVVNDACCSGNWAKEFDGDPMPPNVTALCCCLSTQVSRFEFDITLFEALYGKADYNKDGIVDLDEVIRYCGARIREVQGGKLTPVMHKAKNVKGPVPLTKVNPQLVGVVSGREVFAALVEDRHGDNYQVRVVGFDEGPGLSYINKYYTRDHVILPEDGAPLMVQKHDGWHPASLVSKEGESYIIRYIASNGAQDLVPIAQVRHLFAGNPSEKIPAGLFQQRRPKPAP
jgi:hypothetical protein